RLDCEIDLAVKIVQLIRDLKMDRLMANRLIHGYSMANGEKRGGLVSLKGQSVELAETVDMLELMNMTADFKNRGYGQAPNEMDAFFDERLIYHMDHNENVLYDGNPDDEETEWDDGLGESIDSNPYGAFPLSDQKDGLRYEFIDYIKTADVRTIGLIQKMFFRRENAYSGRVYKAELGHLTATQKSMAWGFINDRKAKLAKIGLSKLDRMGRQVLELVLELGKGPQTRALIMAWANGVMFDLAGVELEFENKPSEEEIFAMWAEYRKL
ncbi:hypothetical protein N9934_05815, partial [Desulfosarcina sp.]|nr:hypothetical protein [Desulfosarcina sp.]